MDSHASSQRLTNASQTPGEPELSPELSPRVVSALRRMKLPEEGIVFVRNSSNDMFGVVGLRFDFLRSFVKAGFNTPSWPEKAATLLGQYKHYDCFLPQEFGALSARAGVGWSLNGCRRCRCSCHCHPTAWRLQALRLLSDSSFCCAKREGRRGSYLNGCCPAAAAVAWLPPPPLPRLQPPTVACLSHTLLPWDLLQIVCTRRLNTVF